MSLDAHKNMVYSCRFEIYIQELHIVMKFPCQIFVQWKNSSLSKKSVPIVKPVQIHNGVANFRDSINIEAELIFNEQKHSFVKKQTFLMVNLITSSRPDQPKLVGRIVLDLADVINNKRYQDVSPRQLQYCSVQASLLFSIHLIQKRLIDKDPNDIQRDTFSDLMSFDNKQSRHSIFGMRPQNNLVEQPVVISKKFTKQIEKQAIDKRYNRDLREQRSSKFSKNDAYTPIKDFYENDNHNFRSSGVNNPSRFDPKEQYRAKSHISGVLIQQHKSRYQITKRHKGNDTQIPSIYKDRKKTDLVVAEAQKAKAEANQIEEQIKKLSEQLQQRQRNFGRQRQRKFDRKAESTVQNNPLKRELELTNSNLKSQKNKRKIVEQELQKLQNDFGSSIAKTNIFQLEQLQKQKISLNEQLRTERQKRRQLQKKFLTQKNSLDNSNQKKIANALKQFENIKQQLEEKLANEKKKRRKAQQILEEFKQQYRNMEKNYEEIKKKPQYEIAGKDNEIESLKEQLEKIAHNLQSEKSMKKSLQENFRQKEEEYLSRLQSFQQELKATKKHLVNQLNESLQKIKQLTTQNSQLKRNNDELLVIKSKLKIELQTQIEGKKRLEQILQQTKQKSNNSNQELENQQGLKDRITGLEDCMDRMQEDLDRQRQSKLNMYKNYQQIKVENDAKQDVIRELQEELKHSHEQIQILNQNLEQTYQKHKQQLSKLKEKQSSILDSYQKEIQELREKNDRLKQQINELKLSQQKPKQQPQVSKEQLILKQQQLKQVKNNLKIHENQIKRLNNLTENLKEQNNYLIKFIDQKEEIIKQLKQQVIAKSNQSQKQMISIEKMQSIVQDQSVVQQQIIFSKKEEPHIQTIEQQQVVETIQFYPQNHKSKQNSLDNKIYHQSLYSSQNQKRRKKVQAQMVQVAESFDYQLQKQSPQIKPAIDNDKILEIDKQEENKQQQTQNIQTQKEQIKHNVQSQNKANDQYQPNQQSQIIQIQEIRGSNQQQEIKGSKEQHIQQINQVQIIQNNQRVQIPSQQKQLNSYSQHIPEEQTQNLIHEQKNNIQQQQVQFNTNKETEVLQQKIQEEIKHEQVEEVIDIYPSQERNQLDLQEYTYEKYEQNNKIQEQTPQIGSIPQIVINLVEHTIPQQQQNLYFQYQNNQQIDNLNNSQQVQQQKKSNDYTSNQQIQKEIVVESIENHQQNVSSISKQQFQAIIVEKDHLKQLLQSINTQKRQLQTITIQLQGDYENKSVQVQGLNQKIYELQNSKSELQKLSQQKIIQLQALTSLMENCKLTHVQRSELQKQIKISTQLKQQLQNLKLDLQIAQQAKNNLITALEQTVPQKLAAQQELSIIQNQKQQLQKTAQQNAQLLQSTNEQLAKLKNLLKQSKQSNENQKNKTKDLQALILKYQQKEQLLKKNLSILEEESRKIFQSVKVKEQNEQYLTQLINFKDQCIAHLEQEKHYLQNMIDEQKSTFKNNVAKLTNLEHENNKLLKKVQMMQTMQNSLVSGQSYRQQVLRNKNKEIYDLNIQLNQKAKQKLEDEEQLKRTFKIKEEQLLKKIQELENKIQNQESQQQGTSNLAFGSQIHEEISILKRKVSEKEKQKNSLENQISEIKAKLQNDNYQLLNVNTRLSQQINDLELQNMEFSKTHDQLDNKAQDMQVIIQELEDDNKKLKVQLQTSRMNNVNLLQEQRRLEAKIVNLENKLKQQVTKTTSLLKSQQNLQAKLATIPSSNTQKESLVNQILKEKTDMIDKLRIEIERKDKQLQEIFKLKNQIYIIQCQNQRLEEENFIHDSEKNQRDVIVDELRAENINLTEILHSFKQNFERRVEEEVRKQKQYINGQIQSHGSKPSSPNKTNKQMVENNNSFVSNKVAQELSIILEQRSTSHDYQTAVRDLIKQKEKFLDQSYKSSHELILKENAKKISTQFQKFKSQLLKSQIGNNQKANLISLTRNYEKIVNQFISSCEIHSKSVKA